MNNLIRNGLFFFVLLVSSAFADSLEESSPTLTGGGRHGAGLKTKVHEKAGKLQGEIVGVCVIGASPSNPMAGPCVNLVVVLNNEDGTVFEKTRTNAQGRFEFSTDIGKKYLLVSGSRFYDVVSPKEPVKGGDQVEMKLQQK